MKKIITTILSIKKLNIDGKIEIDKINIFYDVKSCSVQLERNRNDL